MSGPRRAYDLLRGYINREWDRISGVEELDAKRELEQVPSQDPNGNQHIHHREEYGSEDPVRRARQILGVKETDDYEAIRKAFERLHKRSDPGNFPPGSEEARRAKQIHDRVLWAYQKLSENVGTSEKRFRNLELD
ncbi:MAG: hypothetical protein HONBIEJF_00112 [Fimbriimonadaceae bacterium]|nr:hypothetical protein [Fimbriimonadaceae bacterium]